MPQPVALQLDLYDTTSNVQLSLRVEGGPMTEGECEDVRTALSHLVRLPLYRPLAVTFQPNPQTTVLFNTSGSPSLEVVGALLLALGRCQEAGLQRPALEPITTVADLSFP